MRFEYVSVGPIDDPAVIRFHQGLTVVSGMGLAERGEMFDLLLGALTGTGSDISELAYVDGTGQRIRMARDETGVRFYGEDGREAPSPLVLLGVDHGALRRLMLIEAADLGVMNAAAFDGERPELEEARATLAALQAELTDALAVRDKVEAFRAEVTSLDERLADAEEGVAKRRYARLLGELERVRSEAASVRGGAVVAEADRRFVAAVGDVHRLADAWRDAQARLATEQERFGSRERLDPRTLAEALAAPEQVPVELDELAARYERAEHTRATLASRLNSLASEHLSEPSHPAVIRLAHADQELVWETAHHALSAEEHLAGQSVALGGLSAEGVSASAVTELDAAHDAVDLAERIVEDRFVPGSIGMVLGVLMAVGGVLLNPILVLLGTLIIVASGLWAIGMPRRSLVAARAAEAEALDRAGVPSYIGFQLRRMEVAINPSAKEPLELAAMEYRRALAAWRELAGDISPAEAVVLETETRAYAATLGGLRGTADEMARVRNELVNEAEPEAEAARAALLEACAPFGISDPNLAVELVRHQVTTGSHARLQHMLEQAEAAAELVRGRLDQRLSELGFSGGDMAARIDGFEHARSEAERREQARANARPVDEVENDLIRLEAQVRAEHRPEWATSVTPADGEEPDVEELRHRRAVAMAEYTDASQNLPDIDRLTDRRDAMRRRVAVLAETPSGADYESIDPADLEQLLLARLAAARRVGPAAETVPLVLNEPFAHVHGERKWALLAAIERLSASVQLTYLTDDVDTIVWARRRASAGAVSLLEPVAEVSA